MKLIRRQSLIVLGASALLVAGLLSLLASPFPDALEDSLESHGTQAVVAADGEGSEGWKAPLPNYTVPGVEDESLGGAMAGILGVAATFVALLLLLCLLRQRGDSAGPGGQGTFRTSTGGAPSGPSLTLCAGKGGGAEEGTRAPDPASPMGKQQTFPLCEGSWAAESVPNARRDRAGRMRRGPSHVAMSPRPSNAAGGPRRWARHG